MTKIYDIIVTEAKNMSSPFNIAFGEMPRSAIAREKEIELIEKTFLDDSPESKVYVITGPRGSGKTALLSTLKNDFKAKGFLTVDLNVHRNMEEQFASRLYENGKMYKLFLKPEFSFSFHGLQFSIKGKTDVSDVDSLIGIMLNYLKKKGIKVLVTMDDVSLTEGMKSFVYSYQQMIREGYSVFLLMTGLYESVSEIEESKSLTFFLRAPKMVLKPLNLASIAYSYSSILNLKLPEAAKYAKLTNGYAYGYQLLGSLLYKNGISDDVLSEYDLKLNENAYSLIWRELTHKEKSVLKELSKSQFIKDIMASLNMSNGAIQTYKKRLTDKGIVESNERGSLSFSLPRFKEFVEMQIMLED